MKVYKLFSIFLAVIFSVLVLGFLAFYNDSSRKFIIDHAISYLQSENFSLKIEGANEKLTHIDKIFAKFSGNSLEVYNIDLERDKLFSRPRVKVKKVVFRASTEKSDNKKNVKAEDPKGFDLSETLSSVGKVKLFVESLKIDEATFFFGDNKRRYENLEYKSDGNLDSVSMKTGKSYFNFVLDCGGSGTLNGDFQNIEGVSGNLRVNSLKNRKPEYEVQIERSGYKVSASGSFANNLNTVIISRGQLQFKGKKLDFQGKILLNKGKANLSTKLSLSNFMDTSKMSIEITKNFQDILTDINVEQKGNGINSQIEFKKDSRKLGNCEIVLQEKNLTIKSDVSWISFWGNGLKTIDIFSNDLKNFAINVLGKDVLGGNIKISSNVNYEKRVSLQKFVCEFQKGRIVLVRPLVLNKHNMDTAFKFDIKSFAFLNKYFKVEGSLAGDLLLKNGVLSVGAQISDFVSEKLKMYKGKISGSLNNLKIDVGSANFLGNIFKNAKLKKKVAK